MLEDGIVKKYLDAHCPDKTLRLCPYKDALPRDADGFLWGGGVFDKLGRFAGMDDEMRRIALGCLRDYPGLQLKSVLSETAKQIAMVDTGAGVVNWIWNTYETIENFVPARGAGDEGGAPAARRPVVHRHQFCPSAGRLACRCCCCRSSPSPACAGHAISTSANSPPPWRWRPGQCRRVRHAGDRASPLWRARRLAGGVRRRGRTGPILSTPQRRPEPSRLGRA